MWAGEKQRAGQPGIVLDIRLADAQLMQQHLAARPRQRKHTFGHVRNTAAVDVGLRHFLRRRDAEEGVDANKSPGSMRTR